MPAFLKFLNMIDLNGKRVLIGLSGGINSMAVLCWLKESGMVPAELHLFYAHFQEHSPDTFPFVADGVRFARKHFPCVKVKITRQSILEYFERVKMIPHPARGVCSYQLKIEPINKYAFENNLKIDLIGYVKHEIKKRAAGQQNKALKTLFSLEKIYPIGSFTDGWCFEIVKKHLGWYPAIYDIAEGGKRVFKHNNCLPCKNMYPKDIENVKKYYPGYYRSAMRTAEKLQSYWGRDKAEFYSTFGRDLGQDSTCSNCVW
jgi:hypothetical protein